MPVQRIWKIDLIRPDICLYDTVLYLQHRCYGCPGTVGNTTPLEKGRAKYVIEIIRGTVGHLHIDTDTNTYR
jgi:hypothetical protein